jgi:hypothetical protein
VSAERLVRAFAYPNEVVDQHPWLPGAAERLVEALPRPRSLMAYADPPYFRPPGSHRCFYYGPSTIAGAGTVGAGVIAIKGMEPAAPDIARLLDEFARPSLSAHDITGHLVFEEHKVPGALQLADALLEAEHAAALQAAHQTVYGGLARVPVPLYVLAHSEETVAGFRELLAAHLTPEAHRAVVAQLERGGDFGIYIYYYPATPIRVREVDVLLGARPFRERLLALVAQVGDPGVLLRRWVDLVVRMFSLGFLPTTLASRHTGGCCQAQNACVDGGFVDLGSLTQIVDVRDDAAVHAAVQLTTDDLIETAHSLLVGDGNGGRAELVHLSGYVATLLRESVASQQRQGLTLDPRVHGDLTPSSSFPDLVERLRSRSEQPSEFDEAARRFVPFGLDRLWELRDANS